MDNNTREPLWSEGECILLNSLLDEIIPSSEDGRIPPGGALLVTDFITDKAREEPGLYELITSGLRQLNSLINVGNTIFSDLNKDGRVAVTRDLEKKEPEFFKMLVRYTYMGYYTTPEIPLLFGLSENPPHPLGYTVPDEDPELLKDLTAPVKNRGRCYQDC